MPDLMDEYPEPREQEWVEAYTPDCPEPQSLLDREDALQVQQPAEAVVADMADRLDQGSARLRDFLVRHAGGVNFPSGAEFEDFCQDLVREATRAQARRKKTPDPEVFSATEERETAKWAYEQGFITDLEAQRIVRRLLRLPGKRQRVQLPLAPARPVPARRRVAR